MSGGISESWNIERLPSPPFFPSVKLMSGFVGRLLPFGSQGPALPRACLSELLGRGLRRVQRDEGSRTAAAATAGNDPCKYRKALPPQDLVRMLVFTRPSLSCFSFEGACCLSLRTLRSHVSRDLSGQQMSGSLPSSLSSAESLAYL